MKIPHVTHDSCNSETLVRYCERFPDWDLDLDKYPDFLFCESGIGAWGAPERAYEAAIERGTPLTVEEILRAKYFKRGKWVVRGHSFDSMEDMLARTNWRFVYLCN